MASGRSTWNTYLVWRLNVVVIIINMAHCALENGADLYNYKRAS